MYIDMFNGWYFFWLLLSAGSIVGLYFALRHKRVGTQKAVLFGFLVVGFLMHFLKVYIPPYSVDEARMLRDSWFVNICGANIALFPFFFWSKNQKIKDYMFYIGVISGLIALFYPQEPMAKVDQYAEQLDIVRFYYHHWMVLAVPLLMVLFGHHTLSYKRIISAPTPYTGHKGSRKKHFRSFLGWRITRANVTSSKNPRKLYKIKSQTNCNPILSSPIV